MRQTFRKHYPRRLLNALFSLSKAGCQCRLLPKGEGGFPPWQTVYSPFRRWMASGLLERLLDAVRRAARVKVGRRPHPSAAIIDSQSVKRSHVGGPGRGFDGGKLIKGRKRHIVTDTLGFLLAVKVHEANRSDSQQVPPLLKRLLGKRPG